MSDKFNIVDKSESIDDLNPIVDVTMSKNQFKFLIYCRDYVERIRANGRKQQDKIKERNGYPQTRGRKGLNAPIPITLNIIG